MTLYIQEQYYFTEFKQKAKIRVKM